MTSHGSKVRTYKNGYRNNKRTSIVNTWTQNKCVICGRFLNKRQLKYCSEHISTSKEYHRNYYLTHKEV